MTDGSTLDVDEIIRDIPDKAFPLVTDYRSLFSNDIPLLDVRAPVEFRKGAFPASVNLPLMSDEERHQVGIRYKQAGQDKAIELGAGLINDDQRQIRVEAWARFVAENPHGALYCFRGGLRSRIVQAWLKDAGIEYPVIQGGYKALRQYLITSLTELVEKLDFVLIGGRTGTGKTKVLSAFEGGVVDLEYHARHRGSSFGKMTISQPSNIDFENTLTIELLKLDLAGVKTIYLEDEARMIGRACIPEPLRNAMVAAPIYQLETSMPERVQNCIDDYVVDLCSRYREQHGEKDGFEAYKLHHLDSLDRIRKRLGSERHSQATKLLQAALDEHGSTGETIQYVEFIELLLKDYYDPMYDYQLSKKQNRIVFSGDSAAIIKKVSS